MENFKMFVSMKFWDTKLLVRVKLGNDQTTLMVKTE